MAGVHAQVRRPVRIGVCDLGVLVLPRGDLHRHLRLRLGALSPRAHLLSGVRIVLTGFTGSLMVISVNAWMNHPGGFRLLAGKVHDIHPFKALFENRYLWHELIHMYVAGYLVTGFVLAGVYAFGRLTAVGPLQADAIAIPLAVAALATFVQRPFGDRAARDVANTQPTKLRSRGCPPPPEARPDNLLGIYEHGRAGTGSRSTRRRRLGARHRRGLPARLRARRVPGDRSTSTRGPGGEHSRRGDSRLLRYSNSAIKRSGLRQLKLGGPAM